MNVRLKFLKDFAVKAAIVWILRLQENWVFSLESDVAIHLIDVDVFAGGPHLFGEKDLDIFVGAVEQCSWSIWLNVAKVKCLVNELLQSSTILLSFSLDLGLENSINQAINGVKG